MTPSGAVMRPDETTAQAIPAQYGVHANAEGMIESHRASQNPALQKAALLPVDEDATEEANSDLEAAAGKLDLPDDAELIAASVRGNALVGVVQYPNGELDKVIGGWTDDWEAKLPPEMKVQLATAEAEYKVQAEIARLSADFEQKLDDTRAELQQEMSEQIAQVREEAQGEVEQAHEEAASEAEDGDGSADPSQPKARSSAKKKGD